MTNINILTIICLGLIMAPLKGDEEAKTMDEKSGLHYDGVYYMKETTKDYSFKNTDYVYLRFYDNGTVIRTRTTSRPELAAAWFHKGNIDSKGRYQIKDDNKIKFRIKDAVELHSYEGEIVQDTLKLTVYTSKTTNVSKELFFFKPLEFRK